MNAKIKSLLQITPLKITLCVMAAALLLFIFDFQFFRMAELKTLDLRMVCRGDVKPGGETVIAAIDEKSVAELGRWPWPRTTLARLVGRLKADGAKVIGFDMVFAEPDANAVNAIDALARDIEKSGAASPLIDKLLNQKRRDADTDAVLAQAMEKADNVTLGYFFHFPDKTNKSQLDFLTPQKIRESAACIENSHYGLIHASAATPDDFYLPRAFAPEANIERLCAVAKNSGHFNLFPDRDGSNRWMPLVIAFEGHAYPSLAVSLVQSYLEVPAPALNLESYGVRSIGIGHIDAPTDESGRLLINYLGGRHTFPHYSIADILAGKTPPAAFRDKIVLIGATADGIYDLRVTPFSSAYPGVEIQATVIDNILHRNFLIHSGAAFLIDICAIILSSLLMGLLIARLRPVPGMIAAPAVVCAFVGVNYFAFLKFNIWLNLVYPFCSMILIYAGITICHYVREEREKKKIRGAFQYYLNASVINEILKDPGRLKLGGVKKDLSVLFSDIRGFTAIAEKLSPQDLVALLNEYLTAMTRQVFAFDGLLDKYIGDAVMAVFGAPLPQPDHARRACLTALGMIGELHKLQAKWKKEGRPEIHIGIGVSSGDMVVGNMGSTMRFDYTVTGDAVNLGSRLEGANKEYGTGIIISETTYDAVKNDMCCRELDWVRVRGKTKPVTIYELLAEKKDGATYQGLIDAFVPALAFYRHGEWDRALAAFGKVLEICPGDFVSNMYIERCQNLKEHPPAEPWDGVFVMTNK